MFVSHGIESALEGESKNEIIYRSDVERGDPETIVRILQDFYGCCQSYVVLQEAFFLRKQQEGESPHEFSLASTVVSWGRVHPPVVNAYGLFLSGTGCQTTLCLCPVYHYDTTLCFYSFL